LAIRTGVSFTLIIQNNEMKRRNLIKGLALLPLAGGAITRESVLAASPGFRTPALLH
jgi:hypothetical protein